MMTTNSEQVLDRTVILRVIIYRLSLGPQHMIRNDVSSKRVQRADASVASIVSGFPVPVVHDDDGWSIGCRPVHMDCVNGTDLWSTDALHALHRIFR